LRIFALTGGGTHQFNRGKGENNTLYQYQRRQQAMREEAAVVGNQVKTRGVTIQRLSGT
jgi:hypothetical protein